MVVEIITLVGVVVAIVGVPWYLRGRLAKLEAHVVQTEAKSESRMARIEANSESRMVRIETKLNELIRSSNTLNNLSGTLVHLLHEKKIMDDDDFSRVLGAYTEALDIHEISPNPISPEEVGRLNSYIRKARNGEFFSSDEVQDYNALVSELNREKGDDPNVWPLVALGAFLLGLFLASQSKT